MAWKRTKTGNYTDKQHLAMVQLRKAKRSIAEIAEQVGCSTTAVKYILRKYEVLGPAKRKTQRGKVQGVPSRSVAPPLPQPFHQLAGLLPEKEPEKASDQAPAVLEAYLRWALQGALRKVGDKSFVDRLIADVADGKF